MAGEALSRAGEHIENFKLTPGAHGKFDVIIDGTVVAEHRHTIQNKSTPYNANSYNWEGCLGS